MIALGAPSGNLGVERGDQEEWHGGRQELHLDVLEAVAVACGATPGACVEAECALCIGTLLCDRRAREALSNDVERTNVARGIGTRRAANGRLVDEHDVVDQLTPVKLAMRTRVVAS